MATATTILLAIIAVQLERVHQTLVRSERHLKRHR
jgi:hypothetical protein